jgi:hypothetical protein
MQKEVHGRKSREGQMTDIEKKIRDQKNKIKEDQRELARLQDRAKGSKEQLRCKLETIGYKSHSPDEIELKVSLNKPYDYRTFGLFRKAIESISDKPSEPNS